MNNIPQIYLNAAGIILKAREEVLSGLKAGQIAYVGKEPVPEFHQSLTVWNASNLPAPVAIFIEKHKAQLVDKTYRVQSLINPRGPSIRKKITLAGAMALELVERHYDPSTSQLQGSFTSFEIFSAYMRRTDIEVFNKSTDQFLEQFDLAMHERYATPYSIDQVRQLAGELIGTSRTDLLDRALIQLCLPQRVGIFATQADAALVSLYAKILEEKGPDLHNVRLWFDEAAQQLDARVTSPCEGYNLLTRIMGSAMWTYFKRPEKSKLIPAVSPIPGHAISFEGMNTKGDVRDVFVQASKGTALNEQSSVATCHRSMPEGTHHRVGRKRSP